MKKMIVCTTIHDTMALADYAAMEGWEFIVVCDKKTPPLTLKNAEVLTVSDQEKLDYQIVKVIPFNSIGRRNIGYVHAIANGADIVATVDDDNFPQKDWGFPLVGKKVRMDVVAGTDFFDILRFISKDAIWHRGTDYELLGKPLEFRKEQQEICVGVQANLWHGEPDTDGMCRLTRDVEAGSRSIKDFTRPIGLSKGVYSPFNSQNTAFLREIAVAMLLPYTDYCFRMDDIWASYCAERLMSETDYRVAYGPATVRQDRNPHDIWRDISGEIGFSSILKKYFAFLNNSSLEGGSFFERFVHLSEGIEKQEFAPSGYGQLWRAWVEDLERFL
jgi:hypothetical protein